MRHVMSRCPHHVLACDSTPYPTSVTKSCPNEKLTILPTSTTSLFKSINLDRGLVNGLLGLNRDELTKVIADIVNKAQIPNITIKKTRADLPSFCTAKWAQLAPQFGLPALPPTPYHLQFPSFTTPRYRLPLSLHTTMFENAWHWQDVYREVGDQTREAARVRILEPYLVPILALFQGRVIDAPEQAMAETKYSTGGDVEHEIIMIGGVLFFVIEFKLNTPDANALAQLFLEILSAAEQNKPLGFEGLRIYGLLTNLLQFHFYSYDPITSKFCFDEAIYINTERSVAFTNMIDVSNKIFGVLMAAYIEGLSAVIEKSTGRAKCNDFSSVGSSPAQQLPMRSSSSLPEPPLLSIEERNAGLHESTTQWETALGFAERCCAKFQEPVTSTEDIENNGNDALALLAESVCSIPRLSFLTAKDDVASTPAKLKALAAHTVREAHNKNLSTPGKIMR